MAANSTKQKDRPHPDRLVRQLEKSMSFIRANFHRAPTLLELAAAAELSPFHFHRCFARHFGKSPKRVVDELRIAEARRLLAGNLPIPNIARKLGFAHQSHLIHRFKMLTGTTPGRWRKSLREDAAEMQLAA